MTLQKAPLPCSAVLSGEVHRHRIGEIEGPSATACQAYSHPVPLRAAQSVSLIRVLVPVRTFQRAFETESHRQCPSASNFANPSHISCLFAKRRRMNPGEYRAAAGRHRQEGLGPLSLRRRTRSRAAECRNRRRNILPCRLQNPAAFSELHCTSAFDEH